MVELKNKIYIGSENRQSVYDISLSKASKALIIFVHGYKGFKDWGAWHLVENMFVENGFGFLKFNFSHNGGTVKNPIDFTDLDAFGRNDYTKELYDLNRITTLAQNTLKEKGLEIPIFLLGHSRGGGVSILHGQKDKRISKIVTWASVSSIEDRFPSGEELEDWRYDGVKYVRNERTKQDMPHYYSFYENFLANKENLNIENACKLMNKPFLPIHGDMDLAVSVSEGIMISRWANVKLHVIKGAEHTFQTKHPWGKGPLPEDMLNALNQTKIFFNENLD